MVFVPRGWPVRRPVAKAVCQEQITDISGIILKHFPHARRLHLAFCLERLINSDFYFDDTLAQWDRFANALAEKGHLQAPLTISITATAFQKIHEQAKQEALNKDARFQALDYQFWRWTNGQCALVTCPTLDAAYKVDGATAQNGYWIVRGERDDIPINPYLGSCSGLIR